MSGVLQPLLQRLLAGDPDDDGSLVDILGGVLDGLLRMVPSRLATIMVVDAPRAATVRVARGQGAAAVEGLQVPLGRGVAGFAMASAETVVVMDASQDHRLDPEIDGVDGLDIRTTVVVPLRIGGAVVGSLQLADRDSGAFGTPERAIAEDIAPFLALAAARLRSATSRPERGARTVCRARLEGLEQIDENQLLDVDNELVRSFDRSMLEQCRLVPLRRLPGGGLKMVMADPGDLFALDDFEFATALTVNEIAIASSDVVRSTLDRAFGEQSRPRPAVVPGQAAQPGVSVGEGAGITADGLAADVLAATAGPGVRAVFLDPEVSRGRIRVRSGLGTVVRRDYPTSLHEPLIRRLAADATAGRDDGVVVLPGGRRARWRVEATSHGTRGWLEPLLMPSEIPSLEALGFSPASLVPYRDMIARRGRVVVHAGRRHSDRHLTALIAASEVAAGSAVLVAHPRGALGLPGALALPMAAGDTLASSLEQAVEGGDEVVVAGELRDPLAARLVFEAAAAGALVICTLHAADAVAALVLLRQLEVPPQRLESVLAGVCAHRSVPRLCLACREADPGVGPGSALEGSLQLAAAMRAHGCAACGGAGRVGSVAAHELLRASPELGAELGGLARPERLAELAGLGGMWTFADDLTDKVNRGLVSLDSARRALLE